MASLDMSLDDMIKSRRNSDKGRGQGRGRRGGGPGGSSRGGRTTGPPRRRPLGVNTQPVAFSIVKSVRRKKNLPWQNALLEDSFRAPGMSGLENGTKLYISNLEVGVSNEDIRELFAEIGELIRYGIHYDKHGRPSGSAEVVFARRSDAFQALKKYNNVQLDGKPMKIEIDGARAEVPVAAHLNVVGGANGRRTVVITQRSRGALRNGHAGGLRNGGGGGVGRSRGQGRGRGRVGGGRGGKKTVEKSAEQLDKELESYHAEAMQT